MKIPTGIQLIYGDNPQKINEREGELELKTYFYAPQITAVMQSGNLYVYGGHNPAAYSDRSGQFREIVLAIFLGIVITVNSGETLHPD